MRSSHSTPKKVLSWNAPYRRSVLASLSLFTLATMGVGAAGCAVGPDFVAPSAPSVAGYTAAADPHETAVADGQSQRFVATGDTPGQWWQLFGSTQLDDVVAQAVVGNPTLQSAEASLRQSQASLRAGQGVFLPQLDGNADFSRQQYSPARNGETLPPSIFNLFTLSASVSYALDVFGGERRTVEGLRAAVDVQRDTLNATYITLTANVANTLVAAAAYRAEIDVTSDMIATMREQVRLAEIQYQTGTGPYTAILDLRSQLSAAEADVPTIRQRLDQANDLLASLTGHVPAEWSAPQTKLAELKLPADIPVSLPSELVARRPDILVAEAQLHIASANLGVATAAMLPSISLSGSYGAQSTSTNNLFKSSGTVWDIGAGLSAPLFEGGTLWFQRKAAVAAYQQSQAQYRQVVLSAFVQVADSLRALQHDAETIDAQTQRLSAARESGHLVKVNYETGMANYTQVLLANILEQQAELAYLEAKAQRLQDTIALFVALGGSWKKAATVGEGVTSAAGQLANSHY